MLSMPHPFVGARCNLFRSPPNVWLAHLFGHENDRRLHCEDFNTWSEPEGTGTGTGTQMLFHPFHAP